jgi:hypothetical protein
MIIAAGLISHSNLTMGLSLSKLITMKNNFKTVRQGLFMGKQKIFSIDKTRKEFFCILEV